MARVELDARASPRFWDHQHNHLVGLRRAVQRLVTQHALAIGGGTIVDLGCGDRPYEALFRRCGCEYVGCDLVEPCDVLIRPRQPIPLKDGCADGVVSFQVLEHVWELDWYLGECRRLLKPEGWLLLSTHGNWLYHPHPTDYRRWTRDGLIEELRAHGFAVAQTVSVMGPLAWTTQFRLFAIRHVLRRFPLVGRLIEVPVVIFMNLRMLVEDAITPASVRDSNGSVYVTLSRQAADQRG